MRFVLLLGTLQQVDSLLDITVDLSVNLGVSSTWLTLSLRSCRLGVQRYTLLALVTLQGASEPLRQHEVAVSTDGISLTDSVVNLGRCTAHGLLGSDDIVGVCNPVVVSVPQVVATP